MTPEQVVAIAAFATVVASPVATMVTWLIRFFLPSQGTAARAILWLVAIGASVYSSVALGYWPHFGWATPEAFVESLGLILAVAGWIVAAAKIVYDKMNVQAWPVASDRAKQP